MYKKDAEESKKGYTTSWYSFILTVSDKIICKLKTSSRTYEIKTSASIMQLAF